MGIEFPQTSKLGEIKSYLNKVESQPEWESALLLRPSIRRLVSIRGRLPGEIPGDLEDLHYDLNSFRQMEWKPPDVAASMKTLITVESSYYLYAENYAVWSALVSGHPERIPDFKDIAKELVAWQVWYRWKPDDYSKNGLHAGVVNTLKFLPHQVHKSLTSNLPLSYVDGIEDRGEKIDYSGNIIEMPEYRLRRAVGGYSLEEIFSKLQDLPNRERLAILSVMGYVPGVTNLSQGLKHFHLDTETFRGAFDRGLDALLNSERRKAKRSAHDIVEETISSGVIRDPNGKMTFFDSPRLKLLELDSPEKLEGANLEIYKLARVLDANTFKYSLDEIGEMVGVSKVAVSKRVKRIADLLEKD